LLLAFGSAEARAADYSRLNVSAAVSALDVNATAKPLGATQALMTSAVARAPAAQPAPSLAATVTQSISREAAWLFKGGWPLAALADKYSTGAALDEEANCIATAVYF